LNFRELLKFYLTILTFFITGLATVFLVFKSGLITQVRLNILDENPRPKYQIALVQNSVETKKDSPSKEVMEKITKEPPRVEHVKSGGDLVEATNTNNDGSTTTVISSGGNVDQADASRVLAENRQVGGPYEIGFTDNTGKHADLEVSLKDYINSTLKWGGEIAAMKEIIVKDAGDTGWAGLYSGTYTTSKSGDITSATGFITLNVYYYENDPNFLDYMKLVLSHEYGHHFTLYSKWVNFDLPIGERFPKSYYSTRPLSEEQTATDYSKGWTNCDVEIIAEDYSYFYSGYGIDLASSAHGYPSAATKTWIENFGQGKIETIKDEAPVISFTNPIANQVLAGTVALSASASDDYGVEKVEFYLGNTLLTTDDTVPYNFQFDTTNQNNGAYLLKAKAYDKGEQSSEVEVPVNINNLESLPDQDILDTTQPLNEENLEEDDVSDLPDTELPKVTFLKPVSSPYSWTQGELKMEIEATDNQKVAKIEVYINNTKVLESAESHIVAVWQFDNVGPGEYEVVAKAIDSSNNEKTAKIVVNKS